MLGRWGANARGVGDDCAVLSVPAGERLCVSTDSSVENVHFRRGWLTPEEIGYRAAAAAMSDLAAMGAAPLGMLLAISVPPAWRGDLEAIADGVGALAAASDAPVLGGDTTAGAELSLTVTVLGSAQRPLMRGGARPGDTVWVTGALGGALAALRAFERGESPAPWARERFSRPVPRVREGRWLRLQGATAAVDVSDGLVADVSHVAAASDVRIVLDLDRVPTLGGMDPRDAARSGEEYELALTARELDGERFAGAFGVPLTAIGEVLDGGEPGVETRFRGDRVDLPPGHDHFSP